MPEGQPAEGIHDDPPRINDVGMIDAVAHVRLGNRAFIHEIEWLQDGRVVAYLGVSKPRDTSPFPSDRELTFLNYAPVGAMIAEPDGEAWVVRLPDRDALDRAARTRQRRENDHRGTVVPALKNLVEGRQEMHYEQAGEYGFHDIEESLDELDLAGTEWFHLGQQVGMQKMANLTHRSLMRRLRNPYRGERRWDSPAYDVLRERRSGNPLGREEASADV